MNAPPTAFENMRANREAAELRALIAEHPCGFHPQRTIVRKPREPVGIAA